ncbi:MAG: hypothetical protein IJ860_03280 [Eubacterium sp.]|nr:hypothetical protein [Eubacterium sp.]
MLISEGYFYHISDAFFDLVNEDTLMSNYENGHYRPHFLAIKDADNSSIFWMIPVSSRYTKFQGIYDKQVKKYGRCTKIVLGKCGGKDAAFLIQNAFPVTSDYFDHIHTSQGKPLILHTGTAKTIVSNLNNNLKLHRRGVHLFFADIDKIYRLMEKHLKETDSSAQSLNAEIRKPIAIGDMTREELDRELQKGIDSLKKNHADPHQEDTV